MLHLTSRASIKLWFILITLITAATANASLLDCTSSLADELLSGIECPPAESVVSQAPGYVLQDAIPTAPINAALAAFQVGQVHNTSAISNSAPLLVLIGALLAVLLVRAKRFNTK